MDQNKCVIHFLQSIKKIKDPTKYSCAPQVEKLLQCNTQQNRQLDFHDLNWIFFSIRLDIYLYSNISCFSSLYILGPHTMLFFGPTNLHCYASYSVEQCCILVIKKSTILRLKQIFIVLNKRISAVQELSGTFWSSTLYKVLGLCQVLV